MRKKVCKTGREPDCGHPNIPSGLAQGFSNPFRTSRYAPRLLRMCYTNTMEDNMFIGTFILTICQISISQLCVSINFRLDILCHPPSPTQRAKNIIILYSSSSITSNYIIYRLNSKNIKY